MFHRLKILTVKILPDMKPQTLKKRRMESETTTSPQSMHNTSAQFMNQDPVTGQNDLKRKADSSDCDVKIPVAADFDLTSYDLKAHSLLCAELLNGEGVDRLPEETDAQLVSRFWASWSECKFWCAIENLS